MQKIKAKIYAEALYQSCKETSNINNVLEKFAGILVKNNKLNLVPEIIHYFGQIYNQKENAFDADIETAYKLNSQAKKMIEQLIRNLKKTGKIFISEKVNSDLLGGVIINIEDLMIDGSLRRKLQLIKENIIK